MANPAEPSQVRRFVDLLSPRARKLLIAALFLTFAPLLVVPVESQGYSLVSVVFISVVSGVMGTCYGLSFAWTWRFLPCALLLHLLTFVGYAGALPHWLWPRASGFSVVGLAAVACVSAAYIVFLTIISGEGQRSVRQQTELALARSIHTQLAPPVSARTPWGRIEGRSRASSSMGGDLLDCFDSSEGTVVALADVSGHGVRAGVVMAMLKTALHNATWQAGLDPAVMAQAANLALARLTAPGMFATAWFLHIEADGRTAHVIGCGHPPLCIVRDGQLIKVDAQSIPLGVLEEADIQASSVRLLPSDRLVVHSDGLNEVGSASGNMLGLEALHDVFVELRSVEAAAFVDQVFERVDAHGAADDDCSLMVIDVGPARRGES